MKRSEKGVHEVHCSKDGCKYGEKGCPVVRKLTKTEQVLLDEIRKVNELGALAGMISSPSSDNFHSKEARFIKRLYDNGEIIWATTSTFGSGWVVKDLVDSLIARRPQTFLCGPTSAKVIR